MKNIIFLTLAVFLIYSNSFSQHSCEIKINIKSLPSDTIILGHHFNNQLVPDDTIVTDKKGYGVFTAKNNWPGGMYFLFLPNKKYFDFLLDKNQKFTITADTFNFLNTVKYIGNPENTVFSEYQKFLMTSQTEQDTLMAQYKRFENNKLKQDEVKTKFDELNKNRKDYFEKTISANPDFFFSKFLLSTKQVEVPKTITDQKAQYYYYRNHFWDYFDISDARLLRTPIYEDKIDMFFDKVLLQNPDTLIKESDRFINAARTNDELFRYMLIHLFNKYASSQLMFAENVYVHIAEKYYIPEAKWSSPEFIKDLKDKIVNKKTCLVGNIAKNITFRQIPNDSVKIIGLISQLSKFKTDGLEIEKSKANDAEKSNSKANILNNYFKTSGNLSTLYDIKADYIILWFWTPDCSHCKKETPEFYKLYLEKSGDKKNIQVITLFLSKDLDDWNKHTRINEEWLEYLKDNQLNKWINVWNPFDPFRSNYDISSSPVLYLLDKNYKILAKRIGFEQAFEVIENDKQ